MADTTVVERIEKYIDEKDYKSALSEIKTLSDKDLSDGRAYYQMARLMLDTGNEEDAYDYLRQALNAGYKTAGSCFLMAQSAERHEGFEAVDDYYLQAISLTEDVEEIRGISMFRALYHLRSNKSLSAEKIAKRLIEQFPDSYDGYHLCFLSAMKREKYEEAGSYLDLVSDGFSDNSQYLFDRIELMKAEKDMSEVVAELEADKRYMKTIPIYSLRQKLTYYYDQQDSQKYFETASYLGAKYNDKDAYVALMTMDFARQNYQKSAETAQFLMDIEKDNQGYRFYVALYFQIFNYYYLSGKKPSRELIEWMKKAGEWCIGFAVQNTTEAAATEVLDSIVELFDEIRQNRRSSRLYE